MMITLWSLGLVALPYLVQVAPGQHPQVNRVASVVHAATGWYVLDLTPEEATNLRQQSGVLAVMPDRKVALLYEPTDPLWTLHYQWDLWMLHLDSLWNLTRGAATVRLGMVDQGVDYTHPDLQNAYRGGRDYIDNDNTPLPADTNEWHGTHVAGVMVSTHNNGGMAGIAPGVGLYAVRAFASDSGRTSDIVRGIYWLVDTAGVQVINLSLGSSSPDPAFESAVQYARQQGVLVVAATGNDGTQGVYYPAHYPEVVGVGAADSLGRPADFSNWGDGMDVLAPGTWIPSTIPCSLSGCGYAYASGTSMASPHVAAVAALLLSLDPALTPDQLHTLLRRGAMDQGAPGPDPRSGWGILDAWWAWQAHTPGGPVLQSRQTVVVQQGRVPIPLTGGTPYRLVDATGRTLRSGKWVRNLPLFRTLPRGMYLLVLPRSHQTYRILNP